MPDLGKKVTLYKYMTTKHLKDILENSYLYMDDGSHFNDPFELLVLNNDNVSERIEGLHILCLTNSFRKKLMWSHYTDSHKGVCLTVEIPASLVYSVCYTGHRLSVHDNIDNVIARSVKGKKKGVTIPDYNSLTYHQKVALIKDKKWSFEKEYRIVLDNTELLVQNNEKWFIPVKIKNIYLGVKFDCNFDQNRDIINLCLEKRIKLSQMVLSNTEYSVKPIKWEDG